MKQPIILSPESFIAVHTAVDQTVEAGTPVLRVIKREKIHLYDPMQSSEGFRSTTASSR